MQGQEQVQVRAVALRLLGSARLLVEVRRQRRHLRVLWLRGCGPLGGAGAEARVHRRACAIPQPVKKRAST